MERIEYTYQFIGERGNQAKFLQEVNKLGHQGWRIIHYSAEGTLATALLELSRPSKAS
jgi:hypothetical protein